VFPSGPESADLIVTALRELADTRVLILDLRGHPAKVMEETQAKAGS
jgi:hypothetical protein